MEKQKSPEVRFKGFSDGWKQQTLGDMFIPLSNNTLSRADLNYDNGQIKNIHYGDILVKYAAVLDYKNDKIPFITDGKISDFKSQLLQNGDVIFADTAEDEVVGKAIEINVPADTFIVSGLHTMAYRPKAKLSSFYLGHYLNSNAYHHQLLPLMQGVKVLSISRTNLAKTIVRYPLSEQEQTQIGNFFQNLDQSIALHEKKLAQTQNLKKAMLEKMFPKAGSKQPEIRLKGFSGEWQLDAIGNVLQEVFRPINLDNETKYRLVTVKRRNGGIAERAVLKGKDILVKSQFEVKAGDYVISKRQVVHGATGLVPHELDGSIVSNEYLVGQSTDKLNIEFFALLSTLPEMYKKFFLSSYGVDIEKLFFDVNDWKKREILLPSLAEQIQISVFFKQLDETLALQQQQLQTLKNLKQAFLEKMFV